MVNPETQNQNLKVNKNCLLLVSSFSTKIKNFGNWLPVFACLPEAIASNYWRNFSADREIYTWRQKELYYYLSSIKRITAFER